MKKSSGTVVECLSVGKDQLASMGPADGRPLPALPAGTVNLETMSSTGSGDGMWSNTRLRRPAGAPRPGRRRPPGG
jgi:hypothetical protein